MRSHHAGEWINSMAMVETARQLVENYRRDDPDARVQSVVRTLDKVEFLIIVESNPDGARLSFFDSGRRMWRKNLRPPVTPDGCPGVDCNRNFPKFKLDKIERRINLYIELEQLETRIKALENPTLKTELLAKCFEARQSLRQGRLEDCLASIKAIETKLLEAEAAAPQDFKSESFVRLLDSVRSLAEEGVRAVKAHKAVVPRKPRWHVRTLAWLSGLKLPNAEVRYWLFRPLLSLLLLVLLALAGLKALYIDGSASFGSGGLYDYLGLFMWGLSAQVVQSSLQNLRLPGAGA